MEMTDTLLDVGERRLLAGMIGKSLDSFACDDSVFAPTTFKSAWIKVDGKPYEIRNELQSLPYFGVAEDIGVMSVRVCEPGDAKSHLVGQKLAVRKLGRLIDDVLLYEDTHTLARGGVDVSSYSFTAAIVFQLEGTEIVFEKGIPFEEDIDVYRGPGAHAKIYTPQEMLEEPETGEYVYRAEREVVSLKEWAVER